MDDRRRQQDVLDDGGALDDEVGIGDKLALCRACASLRRTCVRLWDPKEAQGDIDNGVHIVWIPDLQQKCDASGCRGAHTYAQWRVRGGLAV